MTTPILFVFPMIGANRDPLYWGPIMSAVVARGHSVSLLAGHEIDPAKLPGCTVLEPIPGLSLLGFRFPNVWRLYKEIVRHDGVLVINEFSPLCLAALLIGGLFLRRRVVLLVENHVKFLVRYGMKRRGAFLLLRKLAARAASLVLTNNSDGAAYLRDTLGLERDKYMVGPYLTSVLPNTFPPLNDGRSAKSGIVRFAAVGQLIPRKGFDLLIEEFSRVEPELQERISISIFGGGPQYDALQLRIATLGLSGRIVLEGRVPYDSLAERLAKFDCLVISSLADYRSLSAFEAIALGMPLVMSVHDGALTDVLEDGRNGYAFDPEQPGALSLAMGRMLNSDREAMGRESLRIASKHTVAIAAEVLTNAVAIAARTAGSEAGSARVAS